VSASGVRGIVHAVIIAADMDRALVFYRDLLGLRVTGEMVHDGGKLARLGGPRGAEASAAILAAPDGSEIEIACFTAPRGRGRSDAAWPDAGIRSITFAVDDLPGLLDRLAGAGYLAAGEIVSFDTDDGPVRVAYVHGPDGVVLTFMERDGE
jgi:catechol 2,3-dioxygenase-like lactoylglutathione lyase family enzyme